MQLMGRAVRRFLCGIFLVCSLFVTAPISANSEYDAGGSYDPYEGLNRRIFAFNDFADRWFLKPLAKGYRWITPDFVDRSVTNVFNNLGEIRNSLHGGLQGDLGHAGTSFGRLLVNSTLGLGGMLDVASGMGMEAREEDFGQTLAVWGVDEGPYVVLPFLGPSSLRDSFASIPDIFLSPITYVEHVPTRNTLRATEQVDRRADLMDVEQLVTGDRYSFLRDVYLQTREGDVNNGEISDDFDDDFGEDF